MSREPSTTSTVTNGSSGLGAASARSSHLAQRALRNNIVVAMHHPQHPQHPHHQHHHRHHSPQLRQKPGAMAAGVTPAGSYPMQASSSSPAVVYVRGPGGKKRHSPQPPHGGGSHHKRRGRSVDPASMQVLQHRQHPHQAAHHQLRHVQQQPLHRPSPPPPPPSQPPSVASGASTSRNDLSSSRSLAQIDLA